MNTYTIETEPDGTIIATPHSNALSGLFMRRKCHLEESFREKHPDNYKEIVTSVATILCDGYGTPDPENVYQIEDCDTLVYVISGGDNYWTVKIDAYSGEDALAEIESLTDVEQQVEGYMSIAARIALGFTAMGGDIIDCNYSPLMKE